MSWVDDPAQWPVIAEKLIQAGEAGVDCETYAQEDGQSPQYRARIHCWSIARLTDARSPRGYRRAAGVVLPLAALECPRLRSALQAIKLWAHNSPHDEHAFANEGLQLEIEDTLQWLRVAVPGRTDYGLKDAEGWALGYGPRPGFLEMVKYERPVVVSKRARCKGCVCGKNPCRARTTTDWLSADGVWRPHTRVTWRVFTPQEKMVGDRYPITAFVPGASLAPLEWRGSRLSRLDAWWDYSRADAVRGIELVSWLRNRRQVACAYPW